VAQFFNGAVVRPVSAAFRKYPCSLWALTGCGFYFIKIANIQRVYSTDYHHHVIERMTEASKVN
jgi:hypothetical protein